MFAPEYVGTLNLDDAAGGTMIGLCDERSRETVGAASITLSADERTWGVFLTLEDVAMVRAWADRLLAQESLRRTSL